MRVIFAGGGTGGHVYPALSVAEELRSKIPNFKALFIGTRSGLEARVVPGTSYGIRFIFSRGVRGRGLSGKVRTLANLAVGFFQSLRILMQFKPDLVFGSGGYASAAVVLAASVLRCRIVLQEQNSIPGLTNRLLAPRAARVYLGFEKARGYLGNHRGLKVTGNPLRKGILAEEKLDPRKRFGLEKDKPVLLVFGGSQGASSLNRVAVDYLLRHEEVQGIIQTGERNHEWVNEKLRGAGNRIFFSPYIAHIYNAYRAADVALARSGALSVSELAAVGLPAILVPYPYAADNHQLHNAKVLVDAGGAVMIEDTKLSVESLSGELEKLFSDPSRRLQMRRSLLEIAVQDAAERIAADIQALLGRSEKDFGNPGGSGGVGGGVYRMDEEGITVAGWSRGTKWGHAVLKRCADCRA